MGQNPNFKQVTIPAGQTESAELPIPHGELVAPPGKMRDASGNKFKGEGMRPDFRVEASGEGSKIVLSEPAQGDVTVWYRRSTDEDEAQAST